MNHSKPHPPEPEILPSLPALRDVWSRSTAKYRTRSSLLLFVNLVLFAALCCFTFWLRTGCYFPPAYDGYYEIFRNTFHITGDAQVTMYDLLMKPISLKLVPMQAIVIGLLIASLVSTPILITILYRLPAAIPFCLLVGAFAVMPWLGMTLVLSCVIASAWRSKIKFRFAAALLALIPVSIYFFTASQQYAGPVDVLTPPIERGLVVVPLLLAAIASCVFMACVLTIAKIVDYRPGAIAPLLLVMFLGPWLIFSFKVGRDELHYRFLEQTFGPQSREYLADTDAGAAIRNVAFKLWIEHPEPRPTIDSLQDRVRNFFETQLDPIETRDIQKAVQNQSLDLLTAYAQEQWRIVRACQTFLEDFPESRYCSCVLFIMGRALSMRIDLAAFRQSGKIRFYSDFPNQASKETWNTLLENYPNSPLADVARYHLALLASREGKIDPAIRYLQQITVPLAGPVSQSNAIEPHQIFENLLKKKTPEHSLILAYSEYPLKAARLLSLLQENRDPLTGDAALIAYLNCDPRHPNYFQNLQEIIERFPQCKLLDNIQVQLTLQLNEPTARIRRLEQLLGQYPGGDAQPEILYQLGKTCIDAGQLAEARKYFDRILDEYPNSSYAAASRHRWPSTQ